MDVLRRTPGRGQYYLYLKSMWWIWCEIEDEQSGAIACEYQCVNMGDIYYCFPHQAEGAGSLTCQPLPGG
ncbi:hypothetical protein HMPREF3016_06780 [Rothia sp. HMSC065D02]|nr:hypothetical protein HMPREF3016_06780 [Rothia sp. HMSC065D02]